MKHVPTFDDFVNETFEDFANEATSYNSVNAMYSNWEKDLKKPENIHASGPLEWELYLYLSKKGSPVQGKQRCF